EKRRRVEPLVREAARAAHRAEPPIPGDEEHEQLGDAEAAVVADQERARRRDVLPPAHFHAEVAAIEAIEGAAQDLDQPVVECRVRPVDPPDLAQVAKRPEDVDEGRRPPRAPVSPDDVGPGGSGATRTHVYLPRYRGFVTRSFSRTVSRTCSRTARPNGSRSVSPSRIRRTSDSVNPRTAVRSESSRAGGSPSTRRRCARRSHSASKLCSSLAISRSTIARTLAATRA